MKNEQESFFTDDMLKEFYFFQAVLDKLKQLNYTTINTEGYTESYCEIYYDGFYICSIASSDELFLNFSINKNSTNNPFFYEEEYILSYFSENFIDLNDIYKQKKLSKKITREDYLQLIVQHFVNLRSVFFEDFILDTRFNSINVINFRLFKKKKITFDKNITVFIGENGAGKSSILDILNIGLFNLVKHTPLNFKKKDTVTISKNDKRITGPNMISENFCSLEYNTDFGSHRINWTLSNKNKRLNTKKSENMTDAFKFFLANNDEKRKIIYPVFISYSSQRGHEDKSSRQDSNKKFINSKFYAYHDFIKSPNQFSDFKEWYILKKNMLANQSRELDEQYLMLLTTQLKCIDDALITALTELSQKNHHKIIGIDIIKHDIFVILNNGYSYPIHILSDGYKEIISIIADISYRMAILNPHLDENILNSPGIILIDEIDTHLHPKWQTSILYILRKLFPKVQFIVTTHSPIVVAAADKEQVQLINFDKENEVQFTSLGDTQSWYFSEILKTGFEIKRKKTEDIDTQKLFIETIEYSKKFKLKKEETYKIKFLDNYDQLIDNMALSSMQKKLLNSYKDSLET